MPIVLVRVCMLNRRAVYIHTDKNLYYTYSVAKYLHAHNMHVCIYIIVIIAKYIHDSV